LGKVVDIGRPWLDESPMQHLIVSLPYPFGPKLEHFSTQSAHLRLLWLMPVWRQEAEFARDRGAEALQQRLEAAGVNYLDHLRDAVV
jgi:hypothetical protein